MPPPVTPERLAQLFPLQAPAPSEKTFELGLVLGGTVSAGAYTAGALDALLEALEAWYAREKRPHDVIIKTTAGSSGGVVCASILGLLSNRLVPHVRADPPGHDGNPVTTSNPLWDLWVNEFRIERLLATGDMAQNADDGTGAQMPRPQHVPALLNCGMIDAAGQKLALIGATPSVPLPYFAAPFRTAVTVANLRGIPYKILNIPTLGDYSGAAYVQHDDFAWFAFPNGASPTPSPTYVGKQEDEFWLSAPPAPNTTGYDTLVAYATASGAMPVGLAARALTRPIAHYFFRPKVRATTDPPGYRIDWPEPDLDALPDTAGGTYAFTAVDGGTFNNDPVSLVHRALAGLVGLNPRGKTDAKRAILMIDPLADQPKPIARTGKSLLAVVENIVGTFVSSSRYLTADMELFAREDVFSRFQLVPFRPEKGKVGEAALAGTSLFAAAGWCTRRFRVHDYQLGRQNMQVYLQRELVLAGNNPLFDGWSDGDRIDYATDDQGNHIVITPTTPHDRYFLPIVPAKEITPQPVPDWPSGTCDPDSIKPLMTTRLNAVIRQLVTDNANGTFLPWLVKIFAVPGVVDTVVDSIIEAWKTELHEAGLS